MSREILQKVLELVCRELGCDDAHLELGGSAPDRPGALSVDLTDGYRLVAEFRSPDKANGASAARLRALATSFADFGAPPPPLRKPTDQGLAQARLDDELAALAERTGASSALVLDATSPVLWGHSLWRETRAAPANASDSWDVELALQLAHRLELASSRGVDLLCLAALRSGELDVAQARPHQAQIASLPPDERRLLERGAEMLQAVSPRQRPARMTQARVLAELRPQLGAEPGALRRLEHRAEFGYFARGFAGIYALVLCFDARFSELHVEGLALHALPVVERHVLALPPLEPPPRGGRVVQLPRR